MAKKFSRLTAMLLAVLLSAGSVGTVSVSAVNDEADQAAQTTVVENTVDDGDDQTTEAGIPEDDTEVMPVDGLTADMASEYENDGTMEQREAFMQEIQNTNAKYAATFEVENSNSINVSDMANIVPSNYAANMPTTGSANVLVFMVDFKDTHHDETETIDAAEQIFFGEESSLKSFYVKSSYGALTINGDVVDWYTAEHNRQYYIDNGVSALYSEVLDAFDETIDYSDYDADGNGCIDGIYLHFSGENSGWGSVLWSYVTWVFDKTYDGVSIGQRACLLHELNVETVCHETGHMLGLPDYYSYTKISLFGNYSWVGQDDVMVAGAGDHNAVSKMLLGWIPTVKLISAAGGYSLESFTESGDAAIIYPFAETSGDSFFVVQSQKDTSGQPFFKVLRICGKAVKGSDGSQYYSHSNMYGDVPFIELVGNLKGGEAATPYSRELSTYYYNEEEQAYVFSGISIKASDDGKAFNVSFEMIPSDIEPPIIETTVSINQITVTVDFSVPFFVNSSIPSYLIDKEGRKIADMNVKIMRNENKISQIDKVSCVLRVASYREWGYDGVNESIIGSNQNYILKPGEDYTVVFPKGAFQTVNGDIDEIRVDITADTTADQSVDYKEITSFDKCSEFITLFDGRAAYGMLLQHMTT